MKEYIIDLYGISDRESLHSRLKSSLPLPSWYGNNLDALHDALDSFPLPCRITVRRQGELKREQPELYENLIRLFRDLEEDLPGFEIVVEEEEPSYGAYTGGGVSASDSSGQFSADEIDGESGRSGSAASFQESGRSGSSEESQESGRPGSGAEFQESGRSGSVASSQENVPPPAAAQPARTLIITDIHGCYDECMDLLEKMHFDETADRLVCLGDIIDRGPKIYEVFEFLSGLKERMGDRCVLIRGNHEQMMLDSVAMGGRCKELWYYNSGEKTVYSFLHHKHRIQEFVSWFELMPYYYTADAFSCVHASLKDPDPAANDPEVLLWGRETDYEGKLVMTGHTPYRTPLYFLGDHYGRIQEDVRTMLPKEGMIALDTGCVYGNRLTGMAVHSDGTFFISSVPSGTSEGRSSF